MLIKTRKALNEENMKLKDIFIKPINKKIKLSIYEVIMITLFVFVASNGLYHLWYIILFVDFNRIRRTRSRVFLIDIKYNL